MRPPFFSWSAEVPDGEMNISRNEGPYKDTTSKTMKDWNDSVSDSKDGSLLKYSSVFVTFVDWGTKKKNFPGIEWSIHAYTYLPGWMTPSQAISWQSEAADHVHRCYASRAENFSIARCVELVRVDHRACILNLHQDENWYGAGVSEGTRYRARRRAWWNFESNQ